jgi:hypothetical protein
MQEWETYLLRRRQLLLDQLRYVSSQRSRLEEITNGKRTDVSADWLEMTRAEYAQVTRLLFDAGLLPEAQAHEPRAGAFAPTADLRTAGRRVTVTIRAAEVTQELCTPLWVQIPLNDAETLPERKT